ncbi:MAG: RNA methyltransferase [Bacteroidales bacterium]|nr:RNA methyltransferase [Bacteroidales bacterium]MBQ6724997.1 RNA methyltransferase [Bacteroidales bacterium]
MDIIEIKDIDCEELAPYRSLTEAQLKNRLHPEEGIFICESIKVIRIALEHGMEPVSFLCEDKFLDTQMAELQPSVPVYASSREVLRQLTGYDLSRGILSAMRRPTLPSVSEVLKDARRVAVLDTLASSENVGAIFRSAAALGIDALLLTRTCCDPLVRRACRVSMGTVFQVPWTFIDSYDELKQEGFAIAALALADKSIPLDSTELKRCEKLALVLGSEGDGLSMEVLRQADYVVKIPMSRGVDSLNVAAASAVAFWELRK